MNYCMRCGAPNALALNKCQKCGNELKGAITNNNPNPPPSKPTKPSGSPRSLTPEEQQPKNDTQKNMAIIPQMVSADKKKDRGGFDKEPVDGVEVDEDNMSAEDNERDDGPNLNFVPEVEGLEFDSLSPIPPVRGVTFGSLVEEAMRAKASQK